MKNVFASQKAVSVRCVSRVLGLVLVAGAMSGTGITSTAQAAPRRMAMSTISVARANRIARDYIGGNAYVVRNEGIHDGAYRIHVHRNGVARHVFVGARTGRVLRTRIINVRADRREDRPRR